MLFSWARRWGLPEGGLWLAWKLSSGIPWAAGGESSLNLLLIMLWILVPIYTLADGVMDSGVPYSPGEVLVNGLLAGSFFLLGFYRGQAAIIARMPWLGGGTKKPPGSL